MSQGDTVRGFIKDLQWVKNPEAVDFSRSAGGTFDSYAVSQIAGFGVGQSLYRSATVQYDGDPQQGEKLPLSRRPLNWITARVFLQVYLTGPVSLLGYTDTNDRLHIFQQTGSGNPVELLRRKYLESHSNESANVPIWSDEYKQQLNVLAAGCGSLQSAAGRTQYTVDALASFFKGLAACQQATVTEYAPLIKGKRITWIYLTAMPHFSGLVQSDLQAKFGQLFWGYGAGIEFKSRKKPARNSIFVELKYRAGKQDATEYYSVVLGNVRLDREQPCTVDRADLMVAVGSRFSRPQGWGRFFFNVGIQVGTRMTHNVTYPAGASSTRYAGELGGGMVMGAQFGAGVTVRKHSLELRYDYKVDAGASSLSTNQAGLQYSFRLFELTGR